MSGGERTERDTSLIGANHYTENPADSEPIPSPNLWFKFDGAVIFAPTSKIQNPTAVQPQIKVVGMIWASLGKRIKAQGVELMRKIRARPPHLSVPTSYYERL